jgi:glucose/arabinose dehydrogenase
MSRILVYLFCFFLFACANTPSDTSTAQAVEKDKPDPKSNLDKIILPAGFEISLYAENIDNARSMDLSPSGTLFVGTRKKGSVYALRDTNSDYTIDQKFTLAKGLNMPNGVAYKDGDLYVVELNRVLKFSGIEDNLENPGKPEVIYDQYPDKEHHGWKFVAFGPDGYLYIPVGAPCNICESKDEIFGSITRFDLETREVEILHRGIRNTVGFTWHPVTGDLWFTDNGGDWLGDDMPACELNYAPNHNMNFGYPYCHQGDYPDPKLGKGHDCSDFTPPVQKLGPHVAPLGMEFYTGEMLPKSYKNQIFIAEHGSWNRTVPIGYRITLVKLEGNRATSYETFADGWLQNQKAWGRPVDIELMPDGSMLVSDDYADAIYRITYSGEK